MTELPSIYSLKKKEDGGRIARIGFSYQDHVGVKFLIDLFISAEDYDIFFENEDDIVVVNKWQTPVTVEMIQVKSNNLDSRWSVSQLIELEVLQKSLQRGRCLEEIYYRIITSYDVNAELEVLKLSIQDRNPEQVNAVIISIFRKKNDIPQNEKGHDAKHWVNNCLWSKWPDSIESLRSENLLCLEKALFNERATTIPLDQKEELYQKFLALVQDASTMNVEHVFNKDYLDKWMDKQLSNFSIPKKGSERLVEKLEAIKLDSSLIEVAKDFKWKYTLECLNHNFTSRSAINKFKEEVQCMLQTLKIKIDTGELQLESIAFHKYCLAEIDALAQKHNIEQNLARGCMYDITNRCMHRFIRATA
jgi:hypothetical protein